MRKGPKIIIGIIIAIVIIIVGIFGIYFVSFKPSVSTTSVATANAQEADSVAQKFTPQSIEKNATNVGDGKKEVSLSTQELSNVVAYAVSKQPTASKYVTGVKVQPEEGNKIAVYTTGKVKGVSSQAKLNFNISNDNGQTTLHYDSGKVGFVSIPKSELFDEIHDNEYIKVNKQDGTITINPNAINGQAIDEISANGSKLNVILKSLKNN